jgi:hypothetical protein
MTPACFCCKRPAARFDRQIGEWVCEGNADCSISRTLPPCRGCGLHALHITARDCARALRQIAEAAKEEAAHG